MSDSVHTEAATSRPPTAAIEDDPIEPTGLRRWWYDLPVVWKGLVVIVLPMVALLPSMVGAAVLQARIGEMRVETREVLAVNEATNSAVRTLVDAEIGVRSFATSGGESDREVFHAALDALEPQLEMLHDVGSEGFPDTVPTFLDGAYRAARTLRTFEAAIDQGLLRGDNMLEMMGRAGDLREELRIASDAVIDAATSRISQKRADIDALETWLLRALGVGLVAGTVAGGVGIYLLTAGVARRLQVADENASRLAHGVALKPVPRSRDEIGVLAVSLEQSAVQLAASRADLLAARDEAVAATRAKDDFLSRMSHELRTPLTAILGFGQLLQMEDLGPEDRESVDHIVKAGDHLLGLINEVLDISRIETGNLGLSMEPVDVGELVQETIALLHPIAVAQAISMGSSVAPDVYVRADRQRFKQVLLNLLSNGIKYNRTNGTVDVDATALSGAVRISVTDTGMGIADANLARLFTPFERLDATHTEVEGTGVGLAISKGLVEAMGGNMGVESVRGEGSTFWLELAEADREQDVEVEPATNTARAEPDAAAVTRSTSPTVLYVEDNLANTKLMERLFASRAARLEVALQGRLGLELARRLHPVLVVVDLHLPDMSGEAVLRSLKSDPATSSIPVVVISADVNPRSIERLMGAGAVAYLPKPIDVAELMQLLDADAS